MDALHVTDLNSPEDHPEDGEEVLLFFSEDSLYPCICRTGFFYELGYEWRLSDSEQSVDEAEETFGEFIGWIEFPEIDFSGRGTF